MRRESTAFSMVLRDCSSADALVRNAERLELPHGEGRLNRIARQQGIVAAGKDDARIGIAARELDRGGNPLGRLVELDGAARRRNIERDRAAKHDDAVGRAAGRIPRRKALLQRQHQGIAERR